MTIKKFAVKHGMYTKTFFKTIGLNFLYLFIKILFIYVYYSYASFTYTFTDWLPVTTLLLILAMFLTVRSFVITLYEDFEYYAILFRLSQEENPQQDIQPIPKDEKTKSLSGFTAGDIAKTLSISDFAYLEDYVKNSLSIYFLSYFFFSALNSFTFHPNWQSYSLDFFTYFVLTGFFAIFFFSESKGVALSSSSEDAPTYYRKDN